MDVIACNGALSSASLQASAAPHSHKQLISRVNLLTSKAVATSFVKKTLTCSALHVKTSSSSCKSKPFKPDEPYLSVEKALTCSDLHVDTSSSSCKSKQVKPDKPHEMLQDRAKREFDLYIIREAESDEEFWAAAWLRAECHCEDRPYHRYVESLKKKFAEEEFVAVKRRRFGKYGHSIKSLCFMAIRRKTWHNNIPQEHGTLLENVLGTLDISVRQLMPGEAFPGDITRSSLSAGVSALQRPHRYGYIANMCVTKTCRQKGIASSLVKVAIEAGKDWGLNEIYVHVYPTNVAGQRLYISNGFQLVQTNSIKTKPEEVQLLRLVL